MPGSLARELRERVVEAYNNGEGTYDGGGAIRRGPRVRQPLASARARDRVGRGAALVGARHPLKLDAAGQEYVRELLEIMPDSTLGELVKAMEERFGVTMSDTTMSRSLVRMGLTRKRWL